MSILMIGSGIGGLCLAQGFLTSGIEFHIYERDASYDFRAQGDRIRIHGEGVTELRSVLTDEMWALFEQTCPETKLGPIPQLGPVTGKTKAGGPFFGPGVYPRGGPEAGPRAGPGGPGGPGAGTMPRPPSMDNPYTVDRAVLRQVLLSNLKDHISYGRNLSQYTLHDTGVTAHFEDSTSVSGSLPIGADGSRSGVRKQYLPSHKPLDTRGRITFGKTSLAPEFESRFPPAAMAIRFASPEARRAAPQLPPDYMHWVMCLPPPPTLPAAAAALSRELSAHWHPSLKPLFGMQDETQTCLLRLLSSPAVVEAWGPDARITLLGDAIHVMIPAAASGANTVMRDAALLTRLIAAKDVSKESTGEYEEEMRRHLRNFALISLPWLDDVDDAEDASSGRTSSSNGDTSGSKDDANNIANEFEDFGSDFRPGDDEDLIVRDVIHSGGGTIREQEWGFIPSSILYSGHELDPILQQFLRKLYLGFSPDSDSIQGPILPCYMLPSDRSQICFGRETVIGKIAAALVAPDASQPLELSESGPRSGLRTLALCGPGGMGKTSVASGFVQKYKDQFDAVFWVHGDSRAKLLHDFRNIAIELGLVAKDSVDSKDQNLTRNLVKTWLIKPRRSFKPDKRLDALGARWLLVFDGVDDPELVSEVWPYGGGSILITSRDSLAFPNKLELGPLDTAEAAQFLLRLTKKNDDPEERANAQAVAQRVGGFPLALSQMAGIITSRKWTFSAFLQAYDMRESKEMGAPQDVSNNRLASVWAFEDLKHGRQLLNNLSMLDPDGIPERLLMSRPKAHGFNPQLGTHILYQQAKIELLQSSLIFEHRGSRKLSLHRLVQDVARMQMTVQQYCSTFYECVHILSSAWPYEPFGWRHGVERWSACEELFPHIERLLDLADSVADVDNGIDRPYEFARLLTDAGWYHHERGGSDDSARFSDLAQSILETLQDKITDVSGNPGVITKRQIESTLAELQHNKGCFATETNKPLDALKHHSAFNMMMLKELADGAFHDDMRLAISWNELGNAFMLQDLWYKGEECYAKSIQALRQLDKFDTLQLSLPRVNMATACWLTGRSTEAAEILTEALADREKVFGADDKDSFM
ncbi:hypothetical protein MBLNU459_g6204t1 [Dothideomycetes sp. NU459]